jgi:hypothetical protein
MFMTADRETNHSNREELMKKLRLDLDELTVESFDAGEQKFDKGTVKGFVSLFCTEAHNGITCGGGRTCDGNYTCDGEYTCNFKSCGGCDTGNCTNEASCASPSCIYTCAIDC